MCIYIYMIYIYIYGVYIYIYDYEISNDILDKTQCIRVSDLLALRYVAFYATEINPGWSL